MLLLPELPVISSFQHKVEFGLTKYKSDNGINWANKDYEAKCSWTHIRTFATFGLFDMRILCTYESF